MGQWNIIKTPEQDNQWTIDLWPAKTVQWGKIVFSTNGVGTIVYLCVKEWIWVPISHYIEKLTQSG